MKNDLTVAAFGEDLLNTKMTFAQCLQLLSSMDIIDIGELAELGVSKASKVKTLRKNAKDIDFETGWQLKHAQTSQKNNTEYGVIGWIGRKTTAPIVAIITERISGNQYFFHIPPEAHAHLSAATIGIPFDKSGKPKRKNKWWKHEIPSFQHLANLVKIDVL